MTNQNGRAFNEWLRAQLKAKKMSQRQLAQQSGVDHSTISRLIRGDRMPSLGTATKLARGLRELREDAETPAYLGLVSTPAANPTARVEYALRADELLSEAQVRQVMEYSLAVRMRRFGRPFQPDRPERAGGLGPGEAVGSSDPRGSVAGGAAGYGRRSVPPTPLGPIAPSVRPAPTSTTSLRPSPSLGLAGRYTTLRPITRSTGSGRRETEAS
jgi:transcriptional regulator with XRE-family HTH domain